MAQICVACRRLNPRDAAYCFFDGTLLNGGPGGATGGTAVNMASRPFPTPFVFPSGRVCHNFDELALACHQDTTSAADLLRQGHFQTFLSGQGRSDLAMAATEAARAADPERGLDDFLGKLPSTILHPAQLYVHPEEVDLGVLRVGEDRRLELVLLNKGGRLLHGSASCEGCAWLAVGDVAGVQRKMFQVADKAVLPVHVRGRQLRAYNKQQTGQIVLESNGGTTTVTFTVSVPVQPFPEGVLAGALTPRQAAEKAKAAPQEAAALLESGAVARWYEVNGWAYPVQGASASGLAAVQQFFEALGLVPAPRVEVSEPTIRLSGRPGEKVEHVLAIVAQEKRAVFAHGTSDQPWLEVGAPIYHGRTATLPLTVAVPREPGRTLTATIQVAANGKQRFTVPLTLAIGQALPPAAIPVYPAAQPLAPVAVAPPPAAIPLTPPAAVPVAAVAGLAPPPGAAVPTVPQRKTPREKWPLWAHLFPVYFIALGLLVAFGRDLFYRSPSAELSEPPLDPNPVIAVQFQEVPDEFIATPSMRFGLVMLREKKTSDPTKLKSLTFHPYGDSNNTVVRVDDDAPFLFGEQSGRWEVRAEKLGTDATGRERQGGRSVWLHEARKIAIIQHVEIIPGAQTRKLDTCLVYYRIENRDKNPHKVGLRFLLDTFIGDTDGVPFTIPGQSDLCDSMREFTAPAVPDFIEVQETDDLERPGIIAHLSLRVGGGVEPPDRVTLGAWPNSKLQALAAEPRARGQNTGWDVPVLSMKSLSPPDSAVTMYWEPKPLGPKQAREVGFAYGLGTLASAEGGGRLGVSGGDSPEPGAVFTLTAYVRDPVPGETLTLELPDGLTLAEGMAKQPVPPRAPGAASHKRLVTWKVTSEAGRDRLYTVKVISSTGVAQRKSVRVRKGGLFR